MGKYAHFDPLAPLPRQVLGFYDADGFTYRNLPPAESLLALDEGQWANRMATPFVSNGALIPAAAPAIEDCKAQKINWLEGERNAAIEQPVASNALGTPHTYAARAANRQFLNDLVTLGGGGKFTCTDTGGVKARRLHTDAQLRQLASDIKMSIEAHFDRFEVLSGMVASAGTLGQVDQINW